MLTFNKFDSYFFYLVLLVNLLPLFMTSYFPTVDGPAHLYNSRLIVELISDPFGQLADFYVFNDNVNPNWMGHLILGTLLLVFPGFVAEKVLLVLYVLCLPLSFRFFLKAVKVETSVLVYLIFPFTYSFLFYYGFFNFHIGLVFFFLTLALWLRYTRRGLNYRYMGVLLFLSLCLFFSHLFVFTVFLMVLLILNLKNIVSLFSSKSLNRKSNFHLLALQMGILFPALFLFVVYFFTNALSGGEANYLEFSELSNMIWKVQPAKGIKYGKEGVYTKWIFILLCIYMVYFIGQLFFRQKDNLSNYHTKIWGGLTLIAFILFYVLPNGTSTFGFISSRTLVFFFLFLIVFLSTLKFPSWLKIPSFFIFNYVTFALIKIYVISTQNMNHVSEDIISVSNMIEPYSTVHVINDNDYWLFDHLSNYLGADKPVIIEDNLEASLNFFPLKWKEGRPPQFHPECEGSPTTDLLLKNEVNNEAPDYVFIHRGVVTTKKSGLNGVTTALLNHCYKEVFINKNGSMKLFRRLTKKTI